MKGLLIGAIIFGGLGILLMLSWIQAMQLARASKAWPSVAGTITSSGVGQIQKPENMDSELHHIYRAVVMYSYSVEGQDHLGSRITFQDHSSSRKTLAQKIVDKYPEGKHVNVYYDPDFPVQAALERRVGSGNFITVFAGFILLLGGIAMLIVFFVKLFTGK